MAESVNSSTVYLHAEGKLLDKNAVGADSDCGIIATIWNYPTRGQLWRVWKCGFHRGARECAFASADERGQIYEFDIDTNRYHTVRLASNAVSAIEYVHCVRNQLIIAYENGTVLVNDTETKAIVSNIPVSRRQGGIIRLIRCHPSKPIAIFVAENGNISIWNLRLVDVKACNDVSVS